MIFKDDVELNGVGTAPHFHVEFDPAQAARNKEFAKWSS